MTDQSPNAAPAPIRIDPDRLTLAPLDLDPAMFQSPLPVQHYHLVFEDAAIGLAVGVWDTTTMQEAFGPYPTDEFITVLEGTFAIVDGAGAAVTGGQGQSACFRNAIPVSWKQDGYLRKIYLTLEDIAGATPDITFAEGGVIVLDPLAAAPQGGDAPQLHGSRSRKIVFQNDAGTMLVTDCRWPDTETPLAATSSHQLVRVIAGNITLTGADGLATSLGSGDHVFLPHGTRCGWRIAEGTVAWHIDVAPALHAA